MSAGLKLLGSLSQVGHLTQFDLSEDLFIGQKEKDTYNFIFDHAVKYGGLPAESTLEEAGINLPAPEEPPEYYYEKFNNRYLRAQMKKDLEVAADLLNDNEPAKALEGMTDMVAQLAHRDRPDRLMNFSEVGAMMVPAAHQAAKSPDSVGILTGWPTPDLMGGGQQGGDVISVCGRPGAGKTWMMLFMAVQAWMQGKVPLFVSMEMKTLPIMQRLTAIMQSLPVGALMAGELPNAPHQNLFKKMQEGLTEMQGGLPFYLLDGALSSTVDDILLQCQQTKPDIVLIDAAYLLRHPNERMSRFERLTDNVEGIKSKLAEGLNIPVAQSHQLNREAEKLIKKGKVDEVGLDNIANTDSVGQVSSLVMALFQAEALDDNTILDHRHVNIMKGRNGEEGGFDIGWQFDQGPNWMDFSEIEYKSLADVNYY